MVIFAITICGNTQVSLLDEKSPAFISEVIYLPKNFAQMFINFEDLGQARKKNSTERGITESIIERQYVQKRFWNT